MASYVKKCPKCKKIYKYENSIHSFCTSCWNPLEEIPRTEDVARTMRSFTKYCPKCGAYYKYEKSQKTNCDFCAMQLIDSDFTNEQAWFTTVEKVFEWRDLHVKTHPLFDQETHDNRINKAKAEAILQSTSSPRCPKCGSSNFQMVNRKWSLLTGFFTNKVDRVCVNCKTRF